MKHKDWFERIPGEKFIHPIPTSPNEIYGYCNFSDIYAEMVDSVSSPAVFVEIGTMAGLSAAVMTSFIVNSRKPIDFYSIDPLPDLEGEQAFEMYGQDFDVPIYTLMIRNLKSLNLHRYMTQLRMKSVDASQLFGDKSVDFVFIDGEHSEKAVREDFEAWYPKVKPTGVIGGHDYDWKIVEQTVQSISTEVNIPITTQGTSWLMYLGPVKRPQDNIVYSEL